MLALLSLLGIAALVAWLDSASALTYATAELTRRSDGRIVVRDAKGSLLSTVRAGEIIYRDNEKRVTAHDVIFTWRPAALLRRELHINALGARTIRVELGDGGEARLPTSLSLPMTVVIDHAAVGELDLRAGKAQWPIKDIRMAYRGDEAAHRLSDIALSAEAGTLGGNLEIGAHPPFNVSGSFDLAGTPALHSPRLAVKVSGPLATLALEAAGQVGEAALAGTARIEPINAVPLQALTLTARNLDLHALDARLPSTLLAVEISGVPVAGAILAGGFKADNAAPGTIDRARVPIRALTTDYVLSSDAIVVRDLDGVLADGGGRVTGGGKLELANDVPGAAGSEWALKVTALNLAALHGRLINTHLSGRIDAVLEEKVQRVNASLAQRDIAFDTRAKIAGTTVDVEQLTARAHGGELSGHGRFDWSGNRHFQVDAIARNLDPSRFGDFAQASLNGTVNATGQMQPAWAVHAAIAIASGSRLRGSPIGGKVNGDFGADRLGDVTVDVLYASARLRGEGSLGRPADRLRFDLTAPRLQDLASLTPDWPGGLAGRIDAKGVLAGAFDGLGFDVDAHGQRITFDKLSADRLDLKAAVAPGSGYSLAALRTRALTIDARAAGLTWQERSFERAAIEVNGSLAQHTAELAVMGVDIDLSTHVNGGFAPGATWSAANLSWTGTFASLENRGTYAARLTSPAQLQASRDHVALSDARIALPEGIVNVATFNWNAGRITSRGDFAGLPVASIIRLTGTELPLRTTLVLQGDWNVMANPRLNGTLNLRRERGDVYANTTGTLVSGELAFGLTELSASAVFSDDALEATASLKATRLGNASATLAIDRVAGAPPGRIASIAPVHGTVRAQLASLKPLQALLGTTALVDGSVQVDLALGGTTASPSSTGTLAATGLRIDAPQYGLHWRDGVLRARADETVLRIEQFDVVGGEGHFKVTGSIPFAALRRGGDSTAELTWRAEQFRATNRPDLRIVASGDGTVSLTRGRIALKGRLRIDEGRVEFEQTQDATLGDDVVVVGRPRPASRRRFEDVPLDLDLDVDIGPRFSIAGSGLRTTLSGQARVATTPSGTLTARGTLRAQYGTYSAFGQQLTIERGSLVFDGPIDNPTLDIVALRKYLPVEAGVELTGTVRLPRVRLTSNPPVPDGEKLSWLVLGQGLERTAGTDTAALQAAAAALFGRNGPSFGARVAQRIGLDDLSLRSASVGATGASGLDSKVLAFSKRISDRLYVVYEAGLSVANNALRVEYALSRSFTVRAQAGTVSSLGIYFLRSFQ